MGKRDAKVARWFFVACTLAAAAANGCTGDAALQILDDDDDDDKDGGSGNNADGAVPPGSLVCSEGRHACAGKCVADDDPTACGSACEACPAPTNGKATCERGACGASCEAPLVACGNACVDLQRDGRQCGECGRSCGGGNCTAGVCEAVALNSEYESPNALALGGGNVFVLSGFDDEAMLSACAKTGCDDVTEIAVNSTGKFAPFPGWVVGVGESAYAMFDRDKSGSMVRGIYRCEAKFDGCGSPLIEGEGDDSPALFNARAFTGDANTLAWSNEYGAARCTIGDGGCGPGTELQSGMNMTDVTIGANHFAWTYVSNGIGICTRPDCTGDGGTVSILASGDGFTSSPRRVQILGGKAYWINDGVDGKNRIFACSVLGCNGTPTAIAVSDVRITAMVPGASGVYFATERETPLAPDAEAPDPSTPQGVVRKCADVEAGCGATSLVIARDLHHPVALAVDDQYVFVANRGDVGSRNGSVVRVAR